MGKAIYLLGFYIGLWGIIGFLATIFFGFLACCMNIGPVIYYGILILFAITGIVSTAFCVTRKCYNLQ